MAKKKIAEGYMYKVVVTYPLSKVNEAADTEFGDVGFDGGGSTGQERDYDATFDTESAAEDFLNKAIEKADELGMHDVEGGVVEIEQEEDDDDYDGKASVDFTIVNSNGDSAEAETDKLMDNEMAIFGPLYKAVWPDDLSATQLTNLTKVDSDVVVLDLPLDSYDEYERVETLALRYLKEKLPKGFYVEEEDKTASTKTRTAKSVEMDEQSLLSEILGHLADTNTQIQNIEDFRDEIASVRLDKELQLHPMTEDVFEILSGLRKKLIDAREYLINSMDLFAGGGGESSFEEEAE